MKLHKSQSFVIIVGLFIFSYLLESIVAPLKIQLASPYAFLDPLQLTQYPFTTAVIIIRSISLFMTPLLLLSFIPHRYFVKVGILLIIALLSQLYSFQQIISGTTLLPLEWAISISIAGALLILPVAIYILKGTYHTAKTKLKRPKLPNIDRHSDSV